MNFDSEQILAFNNPLCSNYMQDSMISPLRPKLVQRKRSAPIPKQSGGAGVLLISSLAVLFILFLIYIENITEWVDSATRWLNRSARTLSSVARSLDHFLNHTVLYLLIGLLLVLLLWVVGQLIFQVIRDFTSKRK